jgi:putative membrane protein
MKIKTVVFSFALALPTLAVAQAPDQEQQQQPQPQPKDRAGKAKLNEFERNVLAHVHHVNNKEIELGKLAQRQGSGQVKQYADMLIRDHQQSNQKLMAFAKQQGITQIPKKQMTDEDRAEDERMKKEMAELRNLKGAEFDRRFLEMMVKSHQRELALSDPFISQVDHSELDTMLENRKTVLQRHVDRAEELMKAEPQARK